MKYTYIKNIFIVSTFIVLLFFAYLVNRNHIYVLRVLSDSMYPLLSKNDVIFVLPSRSYAIGDIITYKYKGESTSLVTHRIARKTDLGTLITKGDNNSFEDSLPVSSSEVIGTLLYSISLNSKVYIIIYSIFYYLSGLFIGSLVYELLHQS